MTLKTASANGTVSASAAREASVDVVKPGTQHTTVGSVASGTRTARPAPVATTPPKIEAATLSACPSNSVARSNQCARAAAAPPASVPCCWTWAATMPATRTAPEYPIPRPIGIGERTQIRPSPPLRRNAIVAGWCSSAMRAPSGNAGPARPTSA